MTQVMDSDLHTVDLAESAPDVERKAKREQISGNNNQKEKILVEKDISPFRAHLGSHLG